MDNVDVTVYDLYVKFNELHTKICDVGVSSMILISKRMFFYFKIRDFDITFDNVEANNKRSIYT